jgi:hypothetical protein
MDRDSMKRLRMDRRLIGRRAWISQQELDAELAELPDVSDKMAPPQEPDEGGEAGEGSFTPSAT